MRENLEAGAWVLPNPADAPNSHPLNFLSSVLMLFGQRYDDGVTFPIQGMLPAADWTGFSPALDHQKTRLIRELPGHTEFPGLQFIILRAYLPCGERQAIFCDFPDGCCSLQIFSEWRLEIIQA